jgi:hypothetical protein
MWFWLIICTAALFWFLLLSVIEDNWHPGTDKFCARCGVKGGTRIVQGERVNGEIVRRLVCLDCRIEIFLRPWREHRDWCNY